MLFARNGSSVIPRRALPTRGPDSFRGAGGHRDDALEEVLDVFVAREPRLVSGGVAQLASARNERGEECKARNFTEMCSGSEAGSGLSGTRS